MKKTFDEYTQEIVAEIEKQFGAEPLPPVFVDTVAGEIAKKLLRERSRRELTAKDCFEDFKKMYLGRS